MVDLVALKAANERRLANAKLTRGPEFVPVAKRLVAAKQRYLTVSERTGIPWPFIAVTHQRESSQNWARSLAQGDPWNQVSTHVPAGRGPFNSWEEAAYDALVNCGPYAARNKDWSIGALLTLLERYNGLGYFTGPVKGRYPSQPSPYIWSGTDQYSKGKYIRDGVFDPEEVDKQLGCAGLIMAMMSLDPSINLDGGTITQTTTLPPPPIDARDAFWLQRALNKFGADPQIEVDGVRGPATRNAVRAYQLSKGLDADGLVGPATLAAIEADLKSGKTIPTMPVPPDITIGEKLENLVGSFWSHVVDLFKPKGN